MCEFRCTEREHDTYIAVLSWVNMSLTEPPATLRNAELKNPVANRKIK